MTRRAPLSSNNPELAGLPTPLIHQLGYYLPMERQLRYRYPEPIVDLVSYPFARDAREKFVGSQRAARERSHPRSPCGAAQRAITLFQSKRFNKMGYELSGVSNVLVILWITCALVATLGLTVLLVPILSTRKHCSVWYGSRSNPDRRGTGGRG